MSKHTRRPVTLDLSPRALRNVAKAVAAKESANAAFVPAVPAATAGDCAADGGTVLRQAGTASDPQPPAATTSATPPPQPAPPQSAVAATPALNILPAEVVTQIHETTRAAIEHHVAAANPHTGIEKPLCFTDVQRRRLDELLQRNLGSGDEVIASVELLLRHNVQGVDLMFTPQQLERVAMRAIDAPGCRFEDLLREYTHYGINMQIGLM